MADEVAHVGPADLSKSYLNQGALISAARRSRCDAVHPGYGFLSENAEFAEACRKARLVFIGPTPKNISDLGHKMTAKQIAHEAGIPVIPGSGRALESPERAVEVAWKIGYPVMLKAVEGGGGRGMRIARNESELERKFAACCREASTSFGSDAVFMEKLIERARHVEVQILADVHGNVVQLGERDCTVQRRHQKLIEESPSPVVSPEMREALGEAARLIAQKAGYVGAGTVEFLIDDRGRFYFMEMNTRIQVEHPVTEMITGVDLVKRQISIAQGEKLDIEQREIRFKGHAIECRINAEDPGQGFLPTPGRIDQIIFPMGPGIRVDTAAFSGSTIPSEYDSLIAKLVAHADTRAEAIARMRGALLELKIGGLRSTAGLHFSIMNDSVFQSGEFDTTYVDSNIDRLNSREFEIPEIAAIAAAVETYFRTHHSVQFDKSRRPRSEDSWKRSSRSRILWDQP
jgi:acetyl-CoA carboxylase biotin carboxylase subunit